MTDSSELSDLSSESSSALCDSDSDSDTATNSSDDEIPRRRRTLRFLPPTGTGPCIRGGYVPRSTPPPKISLRQPDNKTTGYIIDKVMMPRHFPHFPPGHTQTVAIYYVGYRDNPLARGIVPYDKILEHVSLRELEDWEDKLPALVKQSARENKKARAEEKEQVRQRQEELLRERDRQRKTGGKRLTRGLRKRLGLQLDEPDAGGNREEK
ncbi:uncharacterized protein B0T15DRAFT_491957 [Chaetomium strumarium]|uniref:Uncharacterized protein n=1 Tax=Chaetomium strumarium TaxID=1170767 RepID=A0AAJ0M294_9PEZI|nr:hypothetical protein B0T15DRAFT_491957 [Chaetomium strumarium]